MQRLRFVLLLAVILILVLCACGKREQTIKSTELVNPSLVPSTTIPQTDPPLPWIYAEGMRWDAAGSLLELPLTIPDGLHYQSAMELNGDLLLWSIDDHLQDSFTLELCFLDLDTGDVIAQKDVTVSGYIAPQPFMDAIYVCDNESGSVYELDKFLQPVREWKIAASTGNWFIGSNQTVYQITEDSHAYVVDLKTGGSTPLISGDPETWMYLISETTAYVEYYRLDTGAKAMAILDLTTGQLHSDPFEKRDSHIEMLDGIWLCSQYDDQHIYYLDDANQRYSIITGEAYIDLLPGKQLLLSSYDSGDLRLYDIDGSLISKCTLYEQTGFYSASVLIWSEKYNGYFLWLSAEGAGGRLLFWDISVETEGDALQLQAVAPPEEMQAILDDRVDAVSSELGVNILIGNECDTEFSDFTATVVTDPERIHAAIDILYDALSDYPKGFIPQLRYGSIRSINIQLVSDLIATGNGRYGDGYIAFAQEMWDHYLIVIDIDDVGVDTYYHEFSHIIDSYLAWDATQREDAIFSEEGWNDCNPGWFAGYTYDYSWEQTLRNYDWFIDTYSTINPTEDRARVMEYAMSEYGALYFDGKKGLEGKLDYYCRCIRDAFDTTGWADHTLWEQYN